VIAERDTLSIGARRYAMVILAVVYMFNFIDRQILAILLPAIRDEFQVGDAVLGFLTGTAFALFYVALGIPIARYADRANRRNLLAAALAVWSGMTAISGLAMNIWHLTLARIGVGIGEAGCSPPAHSMIADYYPPEQRNTAMGFYTLGISTGIMFAYLAGGWVAEYYGWRQALFIVGIPGLVLALVVRFTVIEPVRGESEQRKDSGAQPSLLDVVHFLGSRQSFIHMGVAAGLSAFVGYSVVNFLPSFIVRSFDMGLANLGVWLGLIMGIAGGVGYFGGGFLADKLGAAGRHRSLNFLALVTLPAVIGYAVVFLAPSASLALSVLFLPTLIANFYLPTVLGLSQSLVSLRMRAVTSALVLLIINIIGLACGPLLTGMLSDALEPSFGGDSMRYSLLIVCVLLLPWSGWHFWRAGQTIDADLARATEHD
jgi:predicted MFS family arabinose efflux permease